MIKISSFLLALAALTGCCSNTMQSFDKKIESTLGKMTLEEKIGIIHAQSKFSSRGVPRLGVPELWTDDGPHGVRPEVFWDKWKAAGWTNDSCTAYPALSCLAATWDRNLASLYGKSVGSEARYRKKNVLLGPGVNIYRTPLGGRNFEYMGEDPFLASQLVVPYIKGIQSNNVAACVKHYALNNQDYNRHTTNVTVSDRALYEIYLPAFKAAVTEAKVWSVMGAYNLYGGQHMCHNERFLNKILKEDWKFDGAVISDWGGCHDTAEAVSNGLDLEMGTWTDGMTMGATDAYNKYFLAQAYLDGIKEGKFGTEELDDKCRRVLRLMFRTEIGGEKGFGEFASPQHFSDARRIANSGIVLLKNEGRVLPMKKGAKKVVVLGENAILPLTVGGGSSSLKAHHEISVLDGLKAALKDCEVVYERAYVGSAVYKADYGSFDLSDKRNQKQLIADAVKAVEGAEYVIFVGGLNKSDHQDSEGSDRLSYNLPYGQNEVISAVAAVRPDMIFVNISGNGVEMPWLDKLAAVVQGWYCGSEAGNAIADVLTGAVNPSGKLPFTMPYKLEDGAIRSEAQYPGIRDENGIWQENYSEGIYVGYRWFDTQKIKPMFAFGHGLSYTTFEYSNAKVSGSKGDYKVKVSVTNTGDRAGAEVVQLYISDPEASVDRPVKELKGFEKVYLEPGESAVVEFSFGKEALSFYDEAKGAWVCEKGDFIALLASSSDDIRESVKFKL